MSNDWPVWATEEVAIVRFDPGWALAAGDEIAALAGRVQPLGVGALHHIGSTAVPGLDAKPILDLMAAWQADADADQVAAVDAAIAACGYKLVPPALDARPWRRFYIKPRAGRRFAHLHLVSPTHPRWHQALQFRDYLRRHPAVMHAYAALKRRLAGQFARDRERYSQAKQGFIADVLAQAARGE